MHLQRTQHEVFAAELSADQLDLVPAKPGGGRVGVGGGGPAAVGCPVPLSLLRRPHSLASAARRAGGEGAHSAV